MAKLTRIPTPHIFVRHKKDCPSKRLGEAYKKCACWKHVRYCLYGKLHRQPTGEISWAGAERYKQALFEQLKREIYGEPAQAAPKTVRDAANIFLTEIEQRGLGPDYPQKLRRMLARLCEFCEARDIHALGTITNEHVLEFQSKLWEIAKSGGTRQNEHRRMRAFFRWCNRRGYLAKLPPIFSDGYRLKIQNHREQTKPFEPHEYAQILGAVPGAGFSAARAAQIRALILLMRWSGLAITDSVTLPRVGLELIDGNYHAIRTRTKTQVPVNNVVPHFVAEELLALPQIGAYFFWSGDGHPRSAAGQFTKYLKRVFRAAGMPDAHPHQFRDTGAVELLKGGMDIRLVSRWLGHKSITTTEKYYARWNKAQQDLLDEKVRKISQLLLDDQPRCGG
jgi:site-specific recombinase XerD